jgi:hypothetical protein
VIAFHRTATGRDYLTPRQFANLIDFAEKLERSR